MARRHMAGCAVAALANVVVRCRAAKYNEIDTNGFARRGDSAGEAEDNKPGNRLSELNFRIL